MYPCRCYNQNYQRRQNKPKACRPEETITRPESFLLFKTVSAGGINLSSTAGAEREYDLIYLRLDLALKKPMTTILSFACNITFLNAKADLNIQLVKSGVCQPVPVAAPAVYRRTQTFSGSDTIYFTVLDPLSCQTTSCCYLIKMRVTADTSENSMILVTDPVLTAIII